MKSICNKVLSFKNWCLERMPVTAFLVMSVCILSLYFLILIINKVYDSDLFFIVASGKEILKNGILRENIWSLCGGSIVIQQWFYAVILAVVDKADFFGYFLFLLLQVSLLCFLFWRFLSLKKISIFLKVLSIFIVFMFFQTYLISLRPELITIILLMAECLCFERYRDSKNSIYLVCSILLLLVEINMHGSMWVMHVAILIAYTMPNILKLHVIDDHISFTFKQLFLYICFMVFVLFLNPYGLDMVTYLFDSMRSKVFDYIYVVETVSPDLLSGYTLCMILVGIFVFLAYKVNVLQLSTLYMCCGFVVTGLLYVRGNMLVSISMIFVLRDISVWIDDRIKIIDWRKDIQNYLYIVLSCLGLYLLYCVSMCLLSQVSTGLYDSDALLVDVEAYISENGVNDNTRIFTGFNTGAFFEYCGYHNLYIDARPELYMKLLNGTNDDLIDYVFYAYTGTGPKFGGLDGQRPEDQEQWFDSFDFDYVVICTYTETYLRGYMNSRSDYRFVDEASNGMYMLYEKI